MHATESKDRPLFSPDALPLLITCFLFPAGSLAARHWFGHEFIEEPETAFLGLAGFGLLVSALRPRSGKPSWGRSVFLLVLFGLLLAGLILYITPAVDQSFTILIRLEELRPAAYILFGLLWAWTFGTPRRRDFLFWGGVLGALVLTGSVLNFMQAGEIVRPGTLFESETWGALLAVCLCVHFCSSDKPESALTALPGIALALSGLMATMSRTGLIGLAVCALFLARRTLSIKALLLLLCTAAAGLSFLLNEPQAVLLERYSQHWLWWSGLNLLIQHPEALWFGFPTAEPLPLAVPQSLSVVLGVRELYPGDMPPFWLHLLTAWGAAGIALVNALGIGVLARFPSRTTGAVLLMCAILGLGNEMLFSAQMAVPAVLALRLGMEESSPANPIPRDEDFVFSG